MGVGFSFGSRGSFDKTEKFLKSLQRFDVRSVAEAGAKKGVQALIANTPRDTGLTASSWGYEISQNGSSLTITWINTDIENGFPVAIALQYGYGTGTGGYVQGRDYINPAMKPIFDEIAESVWKAVTSV
jgi:hypothetical protein